jgi:hypothetical protein
MLALPLALALLATAEPAAAPASTPAPAPPAGEAAGVPHRPGEQMDFDVEYGGFKLGEARISVGQRAGAILPVFLESRTTGVVGLIKLKQHMVSNLDSATGLPRSSQVDGIEPGYRHSDTAHFDREAGVAEVRERGKYDNTYRIDIPAGTLDFVALIFKLRTLPLVPGSAFEFPVLAGRALAQVVATVEAREAVETSTGEVQALRVRVPTGLTGKFSEKSPTYIWFSDDPRHAVVRISADFSIGRAKAVLTSYKAGQEAP